MLKSFILATIFMLSPAFANELLKPKQGDPLRTEIIDALRPRFEKIFGTKLIFKVSNLQVAGNHALFQGHPMLASGKDIPKKIFDKGTNGQCEFTSKDIEIEVLLERKNGQWLVTNDNMCADDTNVLDFYRRAGLKPPF